MQTMFLYFASILPFLPENLEPKGIGLEGRRMSSLSAACLRGGQRVHELGTLASPGAVSLLLEKNARHILLEVLAPSSLGDGSAAGLQGADSFLPLRSQLQCHFLRGSLDLSLRAPSGLGFPPLALITLCRDLIPLFPFSSAKL